MVRAGRKAAYVEDFVRLGVVTLGWARIPGLGDLRDHDDEHLRRLLAAAGRGQPRADVAELLAFRDEMAVDDMVVTPDPRRGEVLLGRISGPYEYAAAAVVGEHRHLRSVEWLGATPRDLLAPHLAQPLRSWQRTVLGLPHQDAWRAVTGQLSG